MVRREIIVALAVSWALIACSTTKSKGPMTGAKTSEGAVGPVPGGMGPKTEDMRTSDLNNDGKPEVFKYYETIEDPKAPGQKKTILVRQDIDMTWDGKIDLWRYFDVDGNTEKEEWDTDFDGKVDETRFFAHGVLIRSECDRNNDGKPDVIRYYKDGKLERKESDTNEDGQVDRWEYFAGRVLERIGVDRDHDGKVDTWAKKE